MPENSKKKSQKSTKLNQKETTVIDKEDLQELPDVVEQLVDGREIIFQPNEGPRRVSFLK